MFLWMLMVILFNSSHQPARRWKLASLVKSDIFIHIHVEIILKNPIPKEANTTQFLA